MSTKTRRVDMRNNQGELQMECVVANVSRVTRPRKPPSPDTYGGRFALRLTWLRTEAGLDMEQAVKAISKAGHAISVSGLYKLEAGSRSVDIDAYPAFAKAYRIPLNELIPSK